MIVDAHLHVFVSAAEDPHRTVDAIAPAERRAPVELLNETMTQHGVEAAVLVPLGPEDDYVAEAVAADPDRFAAIAVWDGDRDPTRVTARLDRGGFRGVRMFGFDDEVPWPLLERLADDHRLLWMYPGPNDLEVLDEVCDRLPHLEVVLNHTGLVQGGIGVDAGGRPRIESAIPQPTEQTTLALARHVNVSVILSGAYGFSHASWPYPDVSEVTRRVAEAFGTVRLMWASDFPWILDDPGYEQMLALVDRHLPNLTERERADILGRNARRIVWEEN